MTADVIYFQDINGQEIKGVYTHPKQAGSYPGVGHAFANPTGQSWSAKETYDAWSRTLKFLEENLKKS